MKWKLSPFDILCDFIKVYFWNDLLLLKYYFCVYRVYWSSDKLIYLDSHISKIVNWHKTYMRQ